MNLTDYINLDTTFDSCYQKYREYYELPREYTQYVLDTGVFRDLTQKYPFATKEDFDRFLQEYNYNLWVFSIDPKIVRKINEDFYSSINVLYIDIVNIEQIPFVLQMLSLNRIVVNKIEFV